MNPFPPKPRGILQDVARVKTMVRDVLGLAGDVGVTISEIVCRDPACPGLETVILVMPAGEATRLVRLTGPVAAVTAEMLARAVASVGDGIQPGESAGPQPADR